MRYGAETLRWTEGVDALRSANRRRLVAALERADAAGDRASNFTRKHIVCLMLSRSAWRWISRESRPRFGSGTASARPPSLAAPEAAAATARRWLTPAKCAGRTSFWHGAWLRLESHSSMFTIASSKAKTGMPTLRALANTRRTYCRRQIQAWRR